MRHDPRTVPDQSVGIADAQPGLQTVRATCFGERRNPELVFAAIVAVFAVTAMTTVGFAQLNQAKPKVLDDVGVIEHLDEPVPLDLEFLNSDGQTVTLGEFFDGRRPVLLTMNYSNCPRLCIVQLEALVDVMKKMPLTLGDDYQIVTVSIDPLEIPERAKLTKQNYLKLAGRPDGASAWHFLVGREENIKRLAEAIGFGYKYDGNQYIHAAVLMVCTPKGRLSRYLYKVEYDPQTLRLSLVEAAEGRIGSPMDQILLYCFHFDSSAGRYGPAAFNLMRAAGVVTVIALGGMLSVYWLRERRKAVPEAPSQETTEELT